jgi:hypothetical protein
VRTTTSFKDDKDARASEYLTLLVQAGELLGQSLDFHESLRAVCDAAVSTVADICTIDLGTAGATTLVAAAHRDRNLTPQIMGAGSHLSADPGRPDHPVCQVISTGGSFFVQHVDDAWIERHATSKAHADFMRRMKYETLIVVPVSSQIYGIRGALTLVTTRDGRPPLRGPFALLLAQDLGRRCGAVIGKALVYGDVAAVAERFQRAALPRRLPEAPPFRFYSLYEPASTTMMIGGDWYDVFPLPDGRIGISIGDVAGHGAEAAVAMASIKNALQTALVVEPDLVKALDAADFVLRNEIAMGAARDFFCTASLSILDPRAMTLTSAPAGHPGPKIWQPSQGVTDPFVERAVPLGLRHLAPDPVQQSTTLERDSMVVYYTDGLVENEGEFLTGERKLEETIAHEQIRRAGDPALAIRNLMIESEKRDDIAVLVLREES